MPWEFYDMSPDEYNVYAHGFLLRGQRDQVAFRKLYQVIYNSNVKRGDQIASEAALYKHWPLPLIDEVVSITSREYMISTWNRIQANDKAKKVKNADRSK